MKPQSWYSIVTAVVKVGRVHLVCFHLFCSLAIWAGRGWSRGKTGKKAGREVGILVVLSETGRIRFRRARFQTPSSVSFFCPHQVLGRELSEFLSAFYLCTKANSPSLSQNSSSLPRNSVSALFRNSTLEKQYSTTVSYLVAIVRGFEKGLAGGGWRQTNPQKEPKKFFRNVSPFS